MKYGIGKWKTRNGKMAEITGIAEDPNKEFPLEGRVDGASRTWAENGSYYDDGDTHDLDLIGPWKDKEDKPQPLNLMELPVGTWLKLRNGQKRRLCGNDGKYVLVNGGPNTALVQYHENGSYVSPNQPSQLDVVAIWQEPKTLTVWIEVTLHRNGEDYTTFTSSDPADMRPDASQKTALGRRYVKVELVEGEFDDLPVEEK